jgi:nicotinamidase-related amidase
MKSIFLFDIDTQRDLILSTGALAVPGAERLIPKLRRLFDFARAQALTILSTANAREADDAGDGSFPGYCVRGTEGQKKIDDTLLLHPLILENKPINRNFADIVRKHQQIIIEKRDFDPLSNPATEKLMRVLPPYAILFGVPTEHSVKLAALGLRRLGIKVAVVQNATMALQPQEAARAEASMRSLQVEFITLEVLLGALSGT